MKCLILAILVFLAMSSTAPVTAAVRQMTIETVHQQSVDPNAPDYNPALVSTPAATRIQPEGFTLTRDQYIIIGGISVIVGLSGFLVANRILKQF